MERAQTTASVMSASERPIPASFSRAACAGIRQVIFSIDRLSEYHTGFLFNRTAMICRSYAELRFHLIVEIADCNTRHDLTICCLHWSIFYTMSGQSGRLDRNFKFKAKQCGQFIQLGQIFVHEPGVEQSLHLVI